MPVNIFSFCCMIRIKRQTKDTCKARAAAELALIKEALVVAMRHRLRQASPSVGWSCFCPTLAENSCDLSRGTWLRLCRSIPRSTRAPYGSLGRQATWRHHGAQRRNLVLCVVVQQAPLSRPRTSRRAQKRTREEMAEKGLWRVLWRLARPVVASRRHYRPAMCKGRRDTRLDPSCIATLIKR